MLHLKWQAVESEIKERDKKIGTLQERIASYQDRCKALEDKLDALKREKAELAADVAAKRDSADKSVARIKRLETRNNELNIHRQELEDYIDGRKADWEKLNDQVKEYENAIKGMSDNLGSHERMVASKEEDKAASH